MTTIMMTGAQGKVGIHQGEARVHLPLLPAPQALSRFPCRFPCRGSLEVHISLFMFPGIFGLVNKYQSRVLRVVSPPRHVDSTPSPVATSV